MENFTKGPWTLLELSHPGRVYQDYAVNGQPDGCYLVATVSNWNGADQNKANAHLIAAAPDLYEALEELEGLVSLAEWKDEDGYPFMHQAARRAWEALAKARGEAKP